VARGEKVRDKHNEHAVENEVAQVPVKAKSLHSGRGHLLPSRRKRTAIQYVYPEKAEFLFRYAAMEDVRLIRLAAGRFLPTWLPVA
jgi:hypothetical protein